ncbi:uncharacterized protein LOC128215995 [Mya arenaria]|uniref:uncharacterized protein LOC128215995 n=1 Tax=Mya arenaria TaxID=6604 RepID=UPI0022E42C29|nr:uncharacterized protein LOC128215995 [Mya arenaria]
MEMDSPLAPSWFNGFRKRNPEVRMTRPQKLSVIRAKCTSEEVLNNYFKELDKVLKAHNLHESPESIWNIDETGLQTEHSPRKILCMHGEKANAVTSNRGQTVTLIGCGSAAGVHVPPYYVFPGKRWNENLMDGATPGSAGTMSDSGWSNSSVFLKYLENHFLRHVNTRDRPVLALFEVHKSHVNLTLANWGKQHNVVFFVLPPHTSHVTQPLDVGCFGPLKKFYYSECQIFMRKNPGMQLNRYNVAAISGKAYNKGVAAQNLISSFKRAGIYPMNRSQIPVTATAPSEIYQENTPPKSESFLDKRKITSISQASTKKRKSPPTIQGNLLSPTKQALLSEATHLVTDAQAPKKAKRIIFEPVPSTSGLNCQCPQSSSDSEDSEEVHAEDLCCICKRFSPATSAYHLDIVNWGQCDKCSHWTHLKYCTPVRCLRRDSEFLCPHCS